MISVMRKIHMPRLAAFLCCSSVAKWCRRAGFSWASPSTVAGGLVCNRHPLAVLIDFVVVVGFPGHDWLPFKVVGCRRRRNRPLQSGGVPRIVGGGFTVAHRPQEIHHR